MERNRILNKERKTQILKEHAATLEKIRQETQELNKELEIQIMLDQQLADTNKLQIARIRQLEEQQNIQRMNNKKLREEREEIQNNFEDIVSTKPVFTAKLPTMETEPLKMTTELKNEMQNKHDQFTGIKEQERVDVENHLELQRMQPMTPEQQDALAIHQHNEVLRLIAHQKEMDADFNVMLKQTQRRHHEMQVQEAQRLFREQQQQSIMGLTLPKTPAPQSSGGCGCGNLPSFTVPDEYLGNSKLYKQYIRTMVDYLKAEHLRIYHAEPEAKNITVRISKKKELSQDDSEVHRNTVSEVSQSVVSRYSSRSGGRKGKKRSAKEFLKKKKSKRHENCICETSSEDSSKSAATSSIDRPLKSSDFVTSE